MPSQNDTPFKNNSKQCASVLFPKPKPKVQCASCGATGYPSDLPSGMCLNKLLPHVNWEGMIAATQPMCAVWEGRCITCCAQFF